MTLTIDVEKHYPNFSLNAHFRAEPGITALYGPSGAGKSMTLRLISGLLRPDRGLIQLGETVFDRDTTHLPPKIRRVGYMFQHHALFPHMTIIDNIAFGARREKRTQRLHLASSWIQRLHLEGLERRYPHEVSGGEAQRATLARTMMSDPAILLLDEPFSSLDTPNRIRMGELVKELLLTKAIPIILVTHDANEVERLAQTTLLVDRGHIRDSLIKR